MSLSRFVPLLLALCAGAAGAQTRIQSIPLQSPSFTPGADNRVTGWQPEEHGAGNSYRIQLERETPRTPPASLRIMRYGPEPYGQLTQKVAVEPGWIGKTARFTGWLKTKGVTGPGAALVVQAKGGGGAILAHDHMDDRRVRGDTDWKQVSAQVRIPPDAAVVHVAVMLEEDGTLWADDLALELVD